METKSLADDELPEEQEEEEPDLVIDDQTENQERQNQQRPKPTILLTRLRRLMIAAFPGKSMSREVLELLASVTLRMTEELAAGVLLLKYLEMGDPREEGTRKIRLTRDDGFEFLRRNENAPPWSGLWLAREWYDQKCLEIVDEPTDTKLSNRKRPTPEEDVLQQRLTSFFSKVPRVDR